MNIEAALILLASYLIGSIPFSYLVTRWKTGKDIREIGSGNVGATNVLRTTGKSPAVLALILDVGKGVVSVWLGNRYNIGPVAGFAAMIGHSYPVFLSFRGGKSVATGGGAFFMLSPLAIVSGLGVFALLLLIFRIVSLGSLIASACFPLFAWAFGANQDVIVWGTVSAMFIIFRHSENVVQLSRGEEPKLGAGASQHE